MNDLIQEILESIAFNGYSPTKEDLVDDYNLEDDEDIDVDDLVSSILDYLDMTEDYISTARSYLED